MSKIVSKNKVVQKIFFGSPGTGKSWHVRNEVVQNELRIDPTSPNCIKTVFHPEYTYGDFVGKLLPLTNGGKVEYRYYGGHFLKALAQAYKNILIQPDDPEPVALIIDEINRGNSAAIFGTIFQLLDREQDGWSSYDVDISQIGFNEILRLIGINARSESYIITDGLHKLLKSKPSQQLFPSQLNKLLESIQITNQHIKIPANLHLIATMNTSDNSIYYMDSAFKRRWEWEFMNIEGNSVAIDGIAFDSKRSWFEFINNLNSFIKSHYKSVRRVEDKQIGKYFIQGENEKTHQFQITYSEIQNKLLFFIWDSVFSRDKRPLIELLKIKEEKLVTFGDFAGKVKEFIESIND